MESLIKKRKERNLNSSVLSGTKGAKTKTALKMSGPLILASVAAVFLTGNLGLKKANIMKGPLVLAEE